MEAGQKRDDGEAGSREWGEKNIECNDREAVSENAASRVLSLLVSR